MKNRIIKFILIGILVFVAILVIEFCCIYAVQGDNIWNYLKDVWNWYKTLFLLTESRKIKKRRTFSVRRFQNNFVTLYLRNPKRR